MGEKAIIITGNRKGIGRFLSEHYLALGYLVIGCSRAESDLSHPNYLHYACDVGKEKEVISFFINLKKKGISPEILINNAGAASMNHLLTTPEKSFDLLVNTNFKGTFLFIREFSKKAIKTGGSIINFSTVASPIKLEGEAIYASTKSAIEKITDISSKELAPFGIRVNCIGPTPIQTDLIKTVPEEKINELLRYQAIKRLGKFEDVLNVIDFLISPKSEFITGQTIYLGGVSR